MEASLANYRSTNYIGRINRAYKPVARELRAMGTNALSVSVISPGEVSVLRNILSFQIHYEANQWLIANGVARGFPFSLTLPFRNGVTLPYTIEIELRSHARVRANLGAWFTRRGRWFTEPANRANARRIRSLRLPGVGWVHASGGLKHSLQCGGLILPPDDEHPTNRWIVFSAYQGFLVGVRPRIDKYLQAASRLQELLESW